MKKFVKVFEKSIMDDLISIIVPVYNTEKYLKQCIESMIHQTYRSLEIVLINDGSTDGSYEIAENYASIDLWIKIITQEHGGAASARNNGLKNSSGKYIVFADSDDYMCQDMVQYLVERFKNDHIQIAVCGYDMIGEEGKPLAICNIFPDIEMLHEREMWDLYDDHLRTYFTVLWNKMFRRDFLEQLEFQNGKHFEDELFFDAVMKKTPQMTCTSAVKYFYRQRDTSLMGQKAVAYYPDYLEANLARLEYLLTIKKYRPANHIFRDVADIFLECCDSDEMADSPVFSKKLKEQEQKIKQIACEYIKYPVSFSFRVKLTAFLMGKSAYRILRDLYRELKLFCNNKRKCSG